MQKQFLFHRDDALPFTHHLKAAPSLELREWRTNPINKHCPFHKFIGNGKAIKKLRRALGRALGRYNHVCNEFAWFFTGPAGCGKTSLAKMVAQVLDLPFIEISPSKVTTPKDLALEIKKQLEASGLPLDDEGGHKYRLPPCIIFVDEAHALKDKKKLVQALLIAIAPNTHRLETENGWTIDTESVTWIIATTDRGEVFDALDDRFDEVPLKAYTKAQLAQIVGIHHPDLPAEACNLIAHYRSRQARRALRFAEEVKAAHEMEPHRTWDDLIREVADDNGIDQYGMHERHVQILKILGQGPCAKERLPILLGGIKDKEVEKFYMPFLLAETDDQPALVQVTGEGYTITLAGLAELDKRSIKHVGQDALAA
jgi:Holliday junction resolvasome RuvABC ATP-dependent DNA helicase subunit